MKTNWKSIFAILVLLVVYVSVVELNVSSTIHNEIAIETVLELELELSESEQLQDDFLLSSELLLISPLSLLATNESLFIPLHLEKDIFRPPLIS